MAEKEKNTYESEVLPKARSKSNSSDCPDLYPVHGNRSDFGSHDGTL